MTSIKHPIIQKYLQNTNKMYRRSYIQSTQVFHTNTSSEAPTGVPQRQT